MKPIRVLIVDDSITSRLLIRSKLDTDPRIETVGQAADAFEARKLINELRPDVLTLDIELPGLDGLSFLRKIMSLRPMPVVMLSSMTKAGSAIAIEALSLGAVECVAKPGASSVEGNFDNLPEIIVMAARANPHITRQRSLAPEKTTERLSAVYSRATADDRLNHADVLSSSGRAGSIIAGANRKGLVSPSPHTETYPWNGMFVFLGASTGGVEAIETVLKGYPEDCPPTVIVQHMPETFLASFANRLNQRSKPTVELARDGSPLRQGVVQLAPGGAYHLKIEGGADRPVCRLLEAGPRNGHRPSVDILFESACVLKDRAIGIVLTGMGRDGAQQLYSLRQAGARCFAQDQASSVIYGMPRAALESGGAECALPLEAVAKHILSLCRVPKPVREPRRIS
ncbi:chemotaxis response regulator protein-glutamate methylesterase [Albirhodobacter sp. R86504]|uniref:protein-glutamate methylesterase/protein-glutamine glutaminase n=1 Tax=Albirhodobacter sp. R86504 TaxID=3093848 RepID=UPI0036724A9E